jgi:hypothetical protein
MWKEFVRKAPEEWGKKTFLRKVGPTAITIVYGQNVATGPRSRDATIERRNKFAALANYEHCRVLNLAIASSFEYVVPTVQK